MPNTSLHSIAHHYCAEDLPGASIPHARLQQVLHRLHNGQQLTVHSLAFLQQQGLHMMYRLATGELPYDTFYPLARAEQAIRIQATLAAQLAHAAAAQAHEAAEEKHREQQYAQATAARIARENDPSYQAKIRNQRLRAQYGLKSYIEPEFFNRIMGILKKVDAGHRLNEAEIVWLSHPENEYFTDELRVAYHKLEAAFFASEFRTTQNPWAAINASSHYRRCGQADLARDLLRPINAERQSPNIRAALYTTHGGVMRDLGLWEDAIRFGEQAHALQPRDYRPCTLLGAVHMETGRLDQGQLWYEKAIERGAALDTIDRELRSILSRLSQPRRDELQRFLLQHDPARFAWVQKKPRSPRRT